MEPRGPRKNMPNRRKKPRKSSHALPKGWQLVLPAFVFAAAGALLRPRRAKRSASPAAECRQASASGSVLQKERFFAWPWCTICALAQSGGEMTERPATLGTWLRRRRKALDLTQAELAARAGCVPTTIKKIEGGTRQFSRRLAERLRRCACAQRRRARSLDRRA